MNTVMGAVATRPPIAPPTKPRRSPRTIVNCRRVTLEAEPHHLAVEAHRLARRLDLQSGVARVLDDREHLELTRAAVGLLWQRARASMPLDELRGVDPALEVAPVLPEREDDIGIALVHRPQQLVVEKARHLVD